MGRRGSRRRGGWRRKGQVIEAYVRVHAGTGGLRTRRYPVDTAVADIQGWIDDEVTEWRRRHPKGAPGTLARDVATYLQLLADRPALQRDRRTQLACWCAQFGARSRWSLTAAIVETALVALAASGKAASTVKKYRTALYHLFTKLDGRNAPNPLRDVRPPREPDALPRWIPRPIVDAILAALPETRGGRKLSATQATALWQATRDAHANASQLAQAYGVSEAAVRKLARQRSAPTRTASKSAARLRVMANVGLPPAQIRALQPTDLDLTGAPPSVLVRGRKKGGGVRPARVPLTPDGVAALEAFVVADAWGAFSMAALDRMFRRAIRRLCSTLEADPATAALGASLRVQLATAVPYDLRHSYLTEAQLASRNLRATQGLALHADSRMTHRYTLAAVAPELANAADLLAARLHDQRLALAADAFKAKR